MKKKQYAITVQIGNTRIEKDGSAMRRIFDAVLDDIKPCPIHRTAAIELFQDCFRHIANTAVPEPEIGFENNGVYVKVRRYWI